MRPAALLWLGLAAILGTGVTASGADFTAASPSPDNAFVAAADFNRFRRSRMPSAVACPASRCGAP